jgi:HD-like signal output (HDOD) protein
MELLDINAVHTGRILARPIVSDKGAVIFDAGEELTQGHIATLKQWGIKAVAVVSGQTDSAVCPTPAANLRSTAPPPVPYSETARLAAPSLLSGDPASATPAGGFMQAVRESVAERFQFLDTSDEIIKTIFELAVERQSRIALSRPGMVPPRGAAAPAFQTQRPPKPQLTPLLKAGHRMGTLPTLFHRLVEVVNAPDVSANDIAAIISIDPALTARLLRLVNSPFYGFTSKVDTISRAVVLVGTRQLVMLSIGATMVAAFKNLPVSLINMEAFWSHSISCGASARLFAKQMKLPQPESFFVAGLLHDIARLLIYSQLPTHALYLFTEARRQQRFVRDLEEETLGFTHEQLGSELMRVWNCPPELAQRILRHHDSVDESSSVEHAVLPTANMLAQALGYGSSGEIGICPVSPITWKKLGSTPKSILAHCQNLDENVRGLRAMFAAALK